VPTLHFFLTTDHWQLFQAVGARRGCHLCTEGERPGTGAGQVRPAASLRCRALGALIIPAILMVSAACGEKNTYVPPPPPKVTVSQPVKQPVTDYLEFTGNTQAINTVQLKARVEGYVEQVYFKDGDRVKKGQLLFLIQPNTYEAKLKQAEAEILARRPNSCMRRSNMPGSPNW